jgi:hypothetical protein
MCGAVGSWTICWGRNEAMTEAANIRDLDFAVERPRTWTYQSETERPGSPIKVAGNKRRGPRGNRRMSCSARRTRNGNRVWFGDWPCEMVVNIGVGWRSIAMEWALGIVLSLYLVVGCVVLFRRLRRHGRQFLSRTGLYVEFWPLLAVAALWPLYLRENTETGRAETEDTCLSCHRQLPTGAASCPSCGWTWQQDHSSSAGQHPRTERAQE